MPKISASLDGEFLAAIAEQLNEILKGVMYLFLGYLDGATSLRSHAEAEVVTHRSSGTAIRMKTTAVSPTAA